MHPSLLAAVNCMRYVDIVHALQLIALPGLRRGREGRIFCYLFFYHDFYLIFNEIKLVCLVKFRKREQT